MNFIDKALVKAMASAGPMLGEINVANILNDATNESNADASSAPLIAKVKAFGAAFLIIVFIIGIIGAVGFIALRGLLLAASGNDQTRSISKANVVWAVIGTIVIGAAVTIGIFASGIGQNLFG